MADALPIRIGRLTAAETRRWILLGLCAVSFLVYVSAVLVFRVEQRDDFIQERSSIAAAVSHLYYGAPLGNVYAGVLARLLEFDVSLATTLTEASQRKVPAGALLSTTADGNGIGYIVVASVAMGVFGPHTMSLTLALVGMMGASAAAFLWRFRDQRTVVVVLYFTTLTLMLFSPLVSERVYATQIGLAGIRYFSFVAILPTFHLVLEYFDTRAKDPKLPGWMLVPCAVQVIVLVLTVLIRNASAPVIAVVFVGGLSAAWAYRRIQGVPTKILRKAGYMLVVASAFVALLMLSVSTSYLRDGRFTEVVWHRIFLSLGASNVWPFAKIREIYDCRKYIPEGITAGMPDRNSHCILWLYADKHKIPVDVVPTLTYGRVHETALREAFFDIAQMYPLETLKAFTYHKARYIGRSIAASVKFKTAQGAFLGTVFVLALVNLLAFCLASASKTALKSYAPIALASGLLAIFSTFPYFMVWAMVHTSGDLLFHCFFLAGLALASAVCLSHRLLPARLGAHDLAWDPPGRNDPDREDIEDVLARWSWHVRRALAAIMASVPQWQPRLPSSASLTSALKPQFGMPSLGPRDWLLGAAVLIVAAGAVGGLVHHHRILRIVVKNADELRREVNELRKEVLTLERESGAVPKQAP